MTLELGGDSGSSGARNHHPAMSVGTASIGPWTSATCSRSRTAWYHARRCWPAAELRTTSGAVGGAASGGRWWRGSTSTTPGRRPGSSARWRACCTARVVSTRRVALSVPHWAGMPPCGMPSVRPGGAATPHPSRSASTGTAPCDLWVATGSCARPTSSSGSTRCVRRLASHCLRPVLDRALAAEDLLEVVSVVADACQSRCVSAEDIIVALGKRARVVGRADLRAVLTDLAAGTCSLEHLFVTYVVRAHGLPDPSRQVQRTVLETKGRRHEYRDAEWTDEGLTVELDGRTFHDNAQQRDRDLDRDLDDAVEGRTTVRLGWGQVTRRRCRTAHRLAALLAGRGWAGSLQPCPECP